MDKTDADRIVAAIEKLVDALDKVVLAQVGQAAPSDVITLTRERALPWVSDSLA